ncbi:MAG: hypothetical protein H0X34_09580 [Chthoniobacterales bacterium]|nr:hypothetical protein [Chthoniobacterales bacterium]
MWLPFPLRATRSALILSLLCLTSLSEISAGVKFDGIEWSLSAPPAEAGPRSFPALAIHLENRGSAPQTLRVHFDTGPLRSLSGKDLEVALLAKTSKTVLYTLYVPPEATGGTDVPISARADDGTVRTTRLRIKTVATSKATADSVDTRFLRPGEKASYKIKIANTGNVALHCAIHSTTSPANAQTTCTPESIVVAVGASAAASVEVALGGDTTAFTSFVTSAEIQTAELSGDEARQSLYFHTEAFPRPGPPDRTHLFETLKGSVLVGAGAGSGNDGPSRGADGVVREALTLEGLISENTRLQLIQGFTHPSEGNGNQSSALSSLPSGSSRNFFHLGLYNPYFDLEGGEITTAPPRLLSSREMGDGARVAVRPSGKENLQLEAFAERNTLTLNQKDVFGATVSGTVPKSPLEFWRLGTLSKRGDIGPQGRDWDTVGLDTGWKVPLALPLRAELSAAAGENGEGRSGVAWLAGLHYNRDLPGEADTSPLKAGVEFASGDKDFPGQQNGREDRRAYASFRFSANPTYVEGYANYNDSKYKVVPNVEKTLAEEQSLLPDFLLTSQSRLVTAGLRWKTLAAKPGGWHLPSGNAEYEETSYFNKSDFLDKTEEHAVSLNLQPFDQPNPIPGGTDWQLNLVGRGGTETHEIDGAPQRDSRFITVGADLNYNRPAPEFLDRIGGAGRLGAEFSGRYTRNLDNDSEALNRSGLSVTTSASWLTETLSARAGATIYSYAGDGVSDRLWASVTHKVGKGWWAGIEGAFTYRGSGGSSSGGAGSESAVLLTFRHDFELPVSWLPRQGQAEGLVFNDLNNNGHRDSGEPGIEGVKVAVGREQALSGSDGAFSFSPMKEGAYPVTVTPSQDVHFNQSSEHPTEKTVLNKGAVTELAIGMTQPTTCEGQVRFVRELSEADTSPENKSEDLSGIEVICSDGAGHAQRTATRADGFFTVYLDPGTYEITVNPATLKAQQSVTPEKLTIKVERTRIENLTFTVTERPKRIRKTFSAKKL